MAITKKKNTTQKKKQNSACVANIIILVSLFVSSYFTEFKMVMFPLPLFFFSECSITH